MYINQKQLLAGLDRKFVKELIASTKRKSYPKGDFVFREGNHASRFYVLLKGRVKLSIGKTGEVVFTLNHAGEAFGWSSLLGRSVYAASAQCTEETKLIRIDRVTFNMLLEKDPKNGLVLIRHLGEMLGHRLNQAYRMLASRSQVELSPTFGTGQVVEASPGV